MLMTTSHVLKLNLLVWFFIMSTIPWVSMQAVTMETITLEWMSEYKTVIWITDGTIVRAGIEN